MCTPKAILLDTGSLTHRQKENIYDIIYAWNVAYELLTKECIDIHCKCMTFTYRFSLGLFAKDSKTGETYAQYLMTDIIKSQIKGVDMLISDGESALQSTP